MILSIVNNKGGVGKTTTAVNLAAQLAAQGHRTLLLDLDSQASATLSLGVPRADLEPSSAQVMLQDFPIRQAIRKSRVAGLDLVTGSMSLANADLALADALGRERYLGNALEPVRGEYAFILVDCPPSMSLLPINALVACDCYMVPVVPHYLALEGLANLMEAVERVRRAMGVQATLLGLLLTMVDYRTRVTREVIELIRDHYGSSVFETEIRINVRLTEAPSFGMPIFEYDSNSTGAAAYRQLADEVLRRCHKETGP